MGTRRTGIQSEVLLSLALVMGLATAVLGALLLAHHDAASRRLLGRALLAEALAPRPVGSSLVPGTEWWTLQPGGAASSRGVASGPIDPVTRALAERAREAGSPLLQPGRGWEAVRFAVPLDEKGSVAVARLPGEAAAQLRLPALPVVAAVVAADLLIFGAFGAFVLRRRVVLPLQRLVAAARNLGDGEGGAGVGVEGTREVADLAAAFNEMSDALESRRLAVEKVVAELRAANGDLRRARAGLDRAERLAAVGRLAAGVAHEVGNPIAAILALLDLAGRDPGTSEATRAHLARAGREGERVRRILRQLLDFSRPPRPLAGPVDLAAVAEETVALVSAQRRYAAIAFAVHRQGELPVARADSAAVTQILLNLVLNAADAVQGVEAPRVELHVRAAVLGLREGDPPGAAVTRRQPDAVECVVADDGVGISEEDRERIFDPFYTTKPPGEGTGLGLANAARLAAELDGSVELVPPPEGLRTAFALRLPILTDVRSAAPRCAPALRACDEA